MSRNNRDDYYRRDRNDRGDRGRDRNQDYYRSRDKNQSYNWSRSEDNRDNNRGWGNNNYKGNNRQWRSHPQAQKTTRQVLNIKVPDPEQFLINQSPKFSNPSSPKFTTKIEKSSTPPQKPASRVDELKNKITPIDRLWSSIIKQYLNDSQFVQIYRKGKSLAYGEVQYGKSIVDYDEGDKYMLYENQSAQSKIFSRAYFKIWEILDMDVFKDVKDKAIRIASVAEGPGGFIHALIDYRLKQSEPKDKYYAITLKITQNTRNAKDWSDYRSKAHFDEMRKIGYKIKVSYGATGTGDLLKQENINYFVQKDLEKQKCYLVTGDGGIQCIGDKEFDYQQVFNVKLFLGEIITALLVQEIGGKFILKIYDCCFQLTKQLLALLCVFYDKVRIVKPVTSRPGNSQKYMLCQNFLGISPAEQLSLKQLLNQWTQIEQNLSYFQNKEFVTSILNFDNFINYKQIIQNLEKANNYFLQEQIDKLEQGLKLAQDNNNNFRDIQAILRETRWKEQMGYAYRWCQRYGIKSVDVKVVEAKGGAMVDCKQSQNKGQEGQKKEEEGQQ